MSQLIQGWEKNLPNYVIKFQKLHSKLWPVYDMYGEVLSYCGLITSYGNIELGQH